MYRNQVGQNLHLEKKSFPMKEIIEGDARFEISDNARKVGISLSTVHLILKKHLKVRKISARLMPHLLTDEQNRQRVKVAKKLLQMFPKYDKKQFVNVVTGHETWVHYFDPVRKVSNKIWATKHSKRPIIAKRSLSAKKVLYAIFFSGEGVAIKVPVKSITGKYYKDVVLKKLKKSIIRNDSLPLVLNMSVFYMTVHLPNWTETSLITGSGEADLITESDQAVRAVHSCNSWFVSSFKVVLGAVNANLR